MKQSPFAQVKKITARVMSSRVLRTSSIVFAGSGLALAVAIATSALLARLLGPGPFGLVILAMTSVNVIGEFLDVRTSEALIRFMGQALARGERDAALTYFAVGLALDGIVAALAVVLVLLVVPPVIGTYENGATLQTLVGIYIISVPFNLLQNTFESAFHTFKRFKLLTALTTIVQVFSLLLLAALATQGITAVTWGYVICAVVSFVLVGGVGAAILFGGLRGARGRAYRAAWRQILPFTFHTSLMGSLKALAVNLDILLLGAMRPAGEVTFFKLARSTVNLMTLPVAPVSTVIYPLLNEAQARGDAARVRYLIGQFMRYSAALAAAITLVFLVALDELVALVYGINYLPVAALVYIMMIGTALEVVMGWVRKAALIYNRPSLVTYSGFASFMLRFTAAVPLIYALGAVGSAIGFTFGVVVSVLVNVVYVLPRLGLSPLAARPRGEDILKA